MFKKDLTRSLEGGNLRKPQATLRKPKETLRKTYGNLRNAYGTLKEFMNEQTTKNDSHAL